MSVVLTLPAIAPLTAARVPPTLDHASLRSEGLNLEAALEGAGRDQVGPLACALLNTLYLSGAAGEMKRVIAALPDLPPKWRLRIRCWELICACGAGRAAAVVPELPSLLAEVQRVGDPELNWRVLAVCVRAHLLSGNLDEAQEAARRGALAAGEIADPRPRGRSLLDRALVALRQDQPKAAVGWLTEARQHLEAAGDSLNVARANSLQASAELLLGNGSASARLARQAIDGHRAIGNQRSEAMGWLALGRAQGVQGEHAQARKSLSYASEIAHQNGDRVTWRAAHNVLTSLSEPLSVH